MKGSLILLQTRGALLLGTTRDDRGSTSGLSLVRLVLPVALPLEVQTLRRKAVQGIYEV